MFQKAELSRKHFQKVELDRVYPKVEIDRNFIKGEAADARYIKLDDIGTKVVGGKGSVFTATRLLPTVNKVTLLDVPGKFTVDTTGPVVTITNTSGSTADLHDLHGRRQLAAGPSARRVPRDADARPSGDPSS